MPPKTSGKAAKKAGKAQKNISKGDGKKRKHKRKESYAIYIYKAMSIMNSFVKDIFERIAAEALDCAHYTQEDHHHLSGNPDCCASPPPCELAQARCIEGTKAVTKYTSSK
ncbi:Histone H2B.3 [Orchesella cincta]|uniref:Histone H2B.3 n=1 Tax=Orchesella cincta TaxID=48709 RepID=A0A1D2N633_ORCCI|nr:Histone H2B.3 [Orchesella cincta]